MACSASRGYHLTIPAGVDHLPNGLVQAVQNVKTIACTTEEVRSCWQKIMRRFKFLDSQVSGVSCRKLEKRCAIVSVLAGEHTDGGRYCTMSLSSTIRD